MNDGAAGEGGGARGPTRAPRTRTRTGTKSARGGTSGGGSRTPRQERGQRRQEAIAAAAAELLVESGYGAVTHRSVAHRCGVPLGSTTYYFGSLDDLRAAAVGLLVDQWIEHGNALAAELDPAPARRPNVEVAARMLVRAVLPDTTPDGLLAQYELLIGAVRQPVVAAVLRGARPRLTGMLAELIARLGCADWITPDLVLAVVDGAVVSALSEGRDDVMEYAVGLLVTALE